MPMKKTWLLRLTEIREELTAMQVPVVDRAIFERLFGVRRRRAIQLLHHFGGFQAGRTFLIDRKQLIATLERMRDGGDFAFERQRKENLTRELERVRRFRAGAKVSIPIVKEDLERKAPAFPPGIALEAGRLTVAFGTAEELVCKLYGLAQAAANDFEAFKSAAENAGP